MKYISILLVLLLTGCSLTPKTAVNLKDAQSLNSLLAGLNQENVLVQSAKDAIMALQKGDFEAANRALDKGIRQNPKNASLHFLNGLAYHLSSIKGEAKALELAKAGYTLALKYDPENYWAAYFLAYVYLEQKKIKEAENTFAYGLLYAPEHQGLLEGIARASYLNHHPSLAKWASQKLYENNPKKYHKMLALTRAATGDIKGAKALLKNRRLPSSLKRWEKLYGAKSLKTDVFGADDSEDMPLDLSGDDADPDQMDATAQNSKGETVPKMAFIDVVIIQTFESRVQNRGINLLDGLTSTLSGKLFEYSKSVGYDSSGSVAQDSRLFAPSFSASSLKYNLNIFNDGVNKVDILARPSLLAVENKTSTFYSGSMFHVQLASTYTDGSVVDVPVGLELKVRPEFLSKDLMQISVSASRESIETDNIDVGFKTYSKTAKTSVDATAVIHFGETLILSGLTVNERQHVRSGVPLLKDIPIIQYLFSNESDLNTKKSVMILLTPRRASSAKGDVTKTDLEHLSSEEQKFVKELIKEQKIVRPSNIEVITAHLSRNQFYRAFQSFDLEIAYWNREDTIWGSIERTLKFLYY